jgi:GAF domain-containing protein
MTNEHCRACGDTFLARAPVTERVRRDAQRATHYVVIDGNGWLAHRCDVSHLHGLDLTLLRLSTAESVEAVHTLIRSEARTLLGADGATFVLRDGDRCFYVDEDAIAPLWKGQRFPIDECISGWAMQHDEHAVVADITIDERIPLDAYAPTFVKSLAMMPIGRRTTSVAAIGVYWARVHAASEQEIDLLMQLADATADALERVG